MPLNEDLAKATKPRSLSRVSMEELFDNKMPRLYVVHAKTIQCTCPRLYSVHAKTILYMYLDFISGFLDFTNLMPHVIVFYYVHTSHWPGICTLSSSN